MTIIDEYWHDFRGFSGFPSRAHIRLVHETGKPLVAICSQPIYGAGTSVQNAFEILKAEVLARVKARAEREKRDAIAQSMDDLAGTIKASKSLVTALVGWLLGRIASYLRRDTTHRVYLRPELHLVWLEHWPPGCASLGPPDDYLLVREDQTGNPSWIRVDVDKIATDTGYTAELLRKDVGIFTEHDPRRTTSGASA